MAHTQAEFVRLLNDKTQVTRVAKRKDGADPGAIGMMYTKGESTIVELIRKKLSQFAPFRTQLTALEGCLRKRGLLEIPSDGKSTVTVRWPGSKKHVRCLRLKVPAGQSLEEALGLTV